MLAFTGPFARGDYGIVTSLQAYRYTQGLLPKQSIRQKMTWIPLKHWVQARHMSCYVVCASSASCSPMGSRFESVL